MKRTYKFLAFGTLIAAGALFTGCGEDPKPKPASFLRLDYEVGTTGQLESECPYTFDYNSLARVLKKKGTCDLKLEYPRMKATIYISYKPVNNNIDALLRDAETLTYKHVIKADEIDAQPFINQEGRVYGMFSQVGGDAATNAQFYVTDSTRHFLTGSMYFYAKPNFDSLMPAAAYIKEDMKNIMESLRWK